jgi:phage baseplate assembly protein W
MRGPAIYNVISPVIKIDVDLITESVTRILLTVPGERVGNVTFGCKFKTFLFDLDIVMREEMLSDISNAIAKFEPRITINNISIKDMDPQTIAVSLIATINQTLAPFTYDQIIRY